MDKGKGGSSNHDGKGEGGKGGSSSNDAGKGKGGKLGKAKVDPQATMLARAKEAARAREKVEACLNQATLEPNQIEELLARNTLEYMDIATS